MKRLIAVLLSSGALVFATAGSVQGGNIVKVDQTYTLFNPCTNEDVLITETRVYLTYRGGNQGHTMGATGVGQTTGIEYVFSDESFDVQGAGGLRILHLVAPGPEPDLTIRDDEFDLVDPVITCR